MPTVFVSSTFKDLRDHRHVAIDTLERLGFATHAMEKYFASDDRPLDLCLADVATCDLYVGIFAWRYGTIPHDGNPERRSITECEFREAVRLGIPCLLFLSDTGDHWPVDSNDDRALVTQLREELATNWTCGYFDTPEKLGLELSVAVTNWQQKPDFSHYLHELVAEFKELPDLPGHTKNLAITEILPILVSLPNKTESQPVTAPLSEAVVQNRALLLVGDGGFGKSTALRFLAYHYAAAGLAEKASGRSDSGTTLIPILVRLRTGRVSIREQLWAALQRPHFRCTHELFDRWLTHQPFLLLIDGLESVDLSSSLEELVELLRETSIARFVVATRPVSSLSSLTTSTWQLASLQLPNDVGLAALFKTLLGAERGDQLFDTLARHGFLGPFRRPLFARFLALSSPALLEARFTAAAVFHDVIETRFLSEWERANDNPSQRAIMQDFLARVAYDMLAADSDSIAIETALLTARQVLSARGVTVDVKSWQDLLDWTIRHGLLIEMDGRLHFWHAAFRDYFGAVWLLQHGSLISFYRRSWFASWHECLIFYFGFLHGRRLSRAIRCLTIGLRVNVALLMVNPYRTLGERLLFVFRCLVEAGDVGRPWHRVFLRLLPDTFSYFYLSAAHTPIEYSRWNQGKQEGWDPHRFLCDLIGQLRSDEGFAYLYGLHAPLDVSGTGLIHSPDHQTMGMPRSPLNDDGGLVEV